MIDTACPKNQMLSFYVGFEINNFTYVDKVDGTFFRDLLTLSTTLIYRIGCFAIGIANLCKDNLPYDIKTSQIS